MESKGHDRSVLEGMGSMVRDLAKVSLRSANSLPAWRPQLSSHCTPQRYHRQGSYLGWLVPSPLPTGCCQILQLLGSSSDMSRMHSLTNVPIERPGVLSWSSLRAGAGIAIAGISVATAACSEAR